MEAAGLTVARRGWGSAKILVMPRFTVEIIPDLEYGGFTARVPDIPAYGEGATEDEAMVDLRRPSRPTSRHLGWKMPVLV
jgi:hypothetical protein